MFREQLLFLKQLFPKCSPYAAAYKSLHAMNACPQHPCSQTDHEFLQKVGIS